MGLQHPLVLMVLLFGGSGCATAPEFPLHHETEEVRRAAQVMQERERELATLRTEMASTRIAAAKQAAELDELRATVVQLRQESRDSQQAHLETTRTLDARQAELAAVKIERDQLVQAAQPEPSEQKLVALHDTVALLSHELAQLKQQLTVGDAQPEMRRAAATRGRPTGEGTISAFHVVQEASNPSTSSWITVQPGESLWSLAKQYKTTIKRLRAINGLVGDDLRPGQPIRLP